MADLMPCLKAAASVSSDPATAARIGMSALVALFMAGLAILLAAPRHRPSDMAHPQNERP